MKLSNGLKVVLALIVLASIVLISGCTVGSDDNANGTNNNASNNNEIESTDVEEEPIDEDNSALIDPKVNEIIASMHDTVNTVVCYSNAESNAGSRKAKNMHSEFEKGVEDLRKLTYLNDDFNRDLDMLLTLSNIYAYDDDSEYQVDAGIWAHRILHDLDDFVNDTYSNANYNATTSVAQYESAALAFIDSIPDYDYLWVVIDDVTNIYIYDMYDTWLDRPYVLAENEDPWKEMTLYTQPDDIFMINVETLEFFPKDAWENPVPEDEIIIIDDNNDNND